MKKYISSWLLGVLWFSIQIGATEIAHIKEVLEYVADEDTLVVFDIDNTLLQTPTDLGSDQWFSHLVQEQNNIGLQGNAAVANVLPLYFHVQYVRELVPTEASISQDVKQIQKKCDHVICLTARSAPLVVRTLEQLTKNNLKFHILENASFF